MTGEQLKALRLAAGMTQKQAAEAIGLSGDNIKQHIYRWEHGIHKISPHLANTFIASLVPKEIAKKKAVSAEPPSPLIVRVEYYETASDKLIGTQKFTPKK